MFEYTGDGCKEAIAYLDDIGVDWRDMDGWTLVQTANYKLQKAQEIDTEYLLEHGKKVFE